MTLEGVRPRSRAFFNMLMVFPLLACASQATALRLLLLLRIMPESGRMVEWPLRREATASGYAGKSLAGGSQHMGCSQEHSAEEQLCLRYLQSS